MAVAVFALREPQLRKPRLRLPTGPARLQIGRLRGRELAEKAMELGLAVERQADPGLVLRLGEPLSRLLRLLEGIAPRPLYLEDLRAVNETPARERLEIGLTVAPAGQSRRPLPGTADLVDLLECEDDSAVDDARDHRRQLTRGHLHHRLIHESQALLDLTRLDQHLTLSVAGDCGEVRVAEALGACEHLRGDRCCSREVSCRLQLEDPRSQQVRALDAVLAVALEEPLGSAEPAAPRSELAPEHEVQPDPERATNGVRKIVLGEVCVMSAFVKSEVVVVAAEHERRRREPFEVLRGEWLGFVGASESLVGVLPDAVFVKRSGVFELACQPARTLTTVAGVSLQADPVLRLSRTSRPRSG